MESKRRRLVQRRKALGFTQESFAHALGVERTTVNRWESGRTEPRPWARSKIAATLRISVDQLDDLLRAANVDGGLEVAAAKRRAFMTSGLASLSLGLTGSDTAHVNPELMIDLQRVSESLRRAYRTAPAPQLYSSVHNHMQLVLSLRPGDQTSVVRKQMLVTIGEMAATCATILGLDMGRWPEAIPFFELAHRAAAESADDELTAMVLAIRAFHAAYGCDDRTTGLELAEAAGTASLRGACHVTAGWVAAVVSERHAEIGNEADSRRWLDQARSALAKPQDDRSCSGIGAFDLAKLTAYEGGNYRRLGDFASAVRVLSTALSTLDPSMRRHRTTALIDRAEAHHAAGQLDAACADTSAALSLIAETQHADSIRRAERLARSMTATNARDSRQLWVDVLSLKTVTTAAAR
jgi:DNA-binding XRE family transcriptional regulator/tetratricopeptide (TPR) repeat protein